jgi:hypothetical protein
MANRADAKPSFRALPKKTAPGPTALAAAGWIEAHDIDAERSARCSHAGAGCAARQAGAKIVHL